MLLLHGVKEFIPYFSNRDKEEWSNLNGNRSLCIGNWIKIYVLNYDNKLDNNSEVDTYSKNIYNEVSPKASVTIESQSGSLFIRQTLKPLLKSLLHFSAY